MWNILGHEWAVNLLHQHIAQNSIKHAYLFTGPQGVGRRTLALRFAQAINCPNPPSPGVPCGECRTCRQIEKMEHVDLSFIEASTPGGTIKIDQIRDLQRNLSLSPYEAKYRIAILARFDEANASASNALLKILEEPPEKVILLLTAETPESLLPTIVSRCEVLRLTPLSIESLKNGLKALLSLPEEEANLLAHVSQGRPGYAINLHEDPSMMQKRNDCLSQHQALLQSSNLRRFSLIKEHYSKHRTTFRTDFLETLQCWQSLWRDVLLVKTKNSCSIANIDHLETINEIAEHISLEETVKVISSIDQSIVNLNQYSNPRLTIEVLLMDIPQIQR